MRGMLTDRDTDRSLLCLSLGACNWPDHIGVGSAWGYVRFVPKADIAFRLARGGGIDSTALHRVQAFAEG